MIESSCNTYILMMFYIYPQAHKCYFSLLHIMSSLGKHYQKGSSNPPVNLPEELMDRIEQDFKNISMKMKKMKQGQPGDEYEREAGRMRENGRRGGYENERGNERDRRLYEEDMDDYRDLMEDPCEVIARSIYNTFLKLFYTPLPVLHKIS